MAFDSRRGFLKRASAAGIAISAIICWRRSCEPDWRVCQPVFRLI